MIIAMGYSSLWLICPVDQRIECTQFASFHYCKHFLVNSELQNWAINYCRIRKFLFIWHSFSSEHVQLVSISLRRLCDDTMFFYVHESTQRFVNQRRWSERERKDLWPKLLISELFFMSHAIEYQLQFVQLNPFVLIEQSIYLISIVLSSAWEFVRFLTVFLWWAKTNPENLLERKFWV